MFRRRRGLLKKNCRARQPSVRRLQRPGSQEDVLACPLAAGGEHRLKALLLGAAFLRDAPEILRFCTLSQGLLQEENVCLQEHGL